jgi:nucleolar MIF4G domain-containing protein 1
VKRKIVPQEDEDDSDAGTDDGDEDLNVHVSKPVAPKEILPDPILKKRKIDNEEYSKVASTESGTRIGIKSKKLEEDDKEIAALEKKLGIRKGRKLPNSFSEDGLDDILGDIGVSEEEDSFSRKRKSLEDEEWLAKKRRKAVRSTEGFPAQDDEVSSDEPNDGDDDIVDEDQEDVAVLDNSDDSFGGFDSDSSASDNKPESRENPYVPPSTGKPTLVGKYVPPSLREISHTEHESINRLRRRAQGLLNRLTEANLVSILRDVEQLFHTNPRHHVTSVLIELLLNLIMDRTSLMDTFLILHAGFIAGLYRLIGPDFGAHLIEKLVIQLDKFRLTPSDNAASEKQPSNLISLLAELYNFHVVGSTLVFDYIRLFLAELTDSNTELLLRIVRRKSLRNTLKIPKLTYTSIWTTTSAGRSYSLERHCHSATADCCKDR